MHDWTLLKIEYYWDDRKQCLFSFRDADSNEKKLTAIGVYKLLVPRYEEWGPSVSVNGFDGPKNSDGKKEIKIKMQSGDVIELIANEITISETKRRNKAGQKQSGTDHD